MWRPKMSKFDTVKYPEILKGNNFKIPRSIFFKFGTVL
jgi:hypothetical protein